MRAIGKGPFDLDVCSVYMEDIFEVKNGQNGGCPVLARKGRFVPFELHCPFLAYRYALMIAWMGERGQRYTNHGIDDSELA